MAYQLADFAGLEISVAMTAEIDRRLTAHLDKGPHQEDLTFAYWRPSVGATRYTVVITDSILPEEGDRLLQGNVAFLPSYLRRVLAGAASGSGSGIALIHSHLGPGWQGMSRDDVVAEQERLAGAVAGRTGLPVVGLTRGTDGAWSGRLWVREAPRQYGRLLARTVRVVGRRLAITYHPDDRPPATTDSQVATWSVWGQRAQDDLVRTRIGIVGLGSVGSLVAEALSRIGLQRLTYIDFDVLEMRNLDRTHGATMADVLAGLTKVQVAARATAMSHTATDMDLRVVPSSLLTPAGLRAALDCDVLVSCVDRPWPRHLLNAIAYSQLIPVIDGGILARVKPDGTPLHVDWRIHTVGPDRACLVCLGALRRSDVRLEKDGKLDDPDYVEGLSEEDKAFISRRNVFPFSMSVAAHEVLQLIGLVTGQARIGGRGPQRYHAYPGEMHVLDAACDPACEFQSLTASAVDLTPNLPAS
jgi:molybdopterin-synthase adenylyltransferase